MTILDVQVELTDGEPVTIPPLLHGLHLTDSPTDLRTFLALLDGTPVHVVGAYDTVAVDLPGRLVDAIREAVLSLLTTAPGDEVSTQQTADMLGVSRPTVIKLLDDGVLPCRRTSETGHRRIPRTAVTAHLRAMLDQRRLDLDEILATSDELGFLDG
jgi:excisionase family DNA binding protein